jgi:hypothetical protein
MASITGMETGNFTDVNIQTSIRVGDTLNPGTQGQVLLSGGEGAAADWGSNSAVVPNSLTAGTNITYSSGNPSWDGGVADTINAASTTYTASSGMKLIGNAFLTDNDGTTINNSGGTGAQNQVLKVPNTLTAGANVSFLSGGFPVTTYDGSYAVTISSTDTDTTYQGGANITIDTTTNPDTINLDSFPTNLDLSSSTNIIHPPNVFDYAGDLRMSIEMGNFYPNDDSSYFNIGVEDDLSTKIHGTIRVLTSSLEVCGYFIIPNNYTATAVRIDVTNSAGSSVSRTITVASITTYGSTGFTSLGTITTNSEQTLTTTMAGASDKIMLIKIYTTSTSDHIRGGYIKLTR